MMISLHKKKNRQNHTRRRKRGTIVLASWCLHWFLVVLALVWASVSYVGLTKDFMEGPSLFSSMATPVYGRQVEIEWDQTSNITAVYAIPSEDHPGGSLFVRPSSGENSRRIRGIVVLLHACTHSALKFFSASPECEDCVGLSEELRLSRTILHRGYMVIAVTSNNRKSGCWGGDNDSRRVQHVLKKLLEHHDAQGTRTVFAIGASSGGAMAAKLLVDSVVESSMVMVMGLRDKLLDKLFALSPTANTRKLYLAPMVKDQGTTKRARANYQYARSHDHSSVRIILDESSCVSLPVTPEYLWNRVPSMTLEAAGIIVDRLLQEGHLDPKTLHLLVDPTKSNWREFFLHSPTPKSLQSFSKPENSNILWGKFDLTPGMSPLAKALHRAWAFHEYCSEAVDLALDFFEKKEP